MVIPLREKTLDRCGGKALGLSQLLHADLPVPSGLCLSGDVYAQALENETFPPLARKKLSAWTPQAELDKAFRLQLGSLKWPVIVRSSASCEDMQSCTSPGIFISVGGLCTYDDVIAAIRKCWCSLWSDDALRFFLSIGRSPENEWMAVVVQQQIEAKTSGFALSKDHSEKHCVRIESVDGCATALAQGIVNPYISMIPRDVSLAGDKTQRDQRHTELVLACRSIEQILGGTVEVEWVEDSVGQLWIVQARKIAAQANDFTPPTQEQTCRALHWIWDAEHNPDPLSPAHASLIALIDQGFDRATRLAVIGGYLYEGRSAAASDRKKANAKQRGEPLTERWIDQQHRLVRKTRNHAQPADALQAAVDFFQLFYRRYQALPRQQSDAIFVLREFLQVHCHDDCTESAMQLSTGGQHAAVDFTQKLMQWFERHKDDAEVTSWLSYIESQPCKIPMPRSLKALMDRYGKLSPAWDIVNPTFGERPASILSWLRGYDHYVRACERSKSRRVTEQLFARVQQSLATQDLQTRFKKLVEHARDARTAGENDDLLFANALFVVREAVLEAGKRLVQRGYLETAEQAFWLSLTTLRSALTDKRQDLRRVVSESRDKWEISRRRTPPSIIRGTTPFWPPFRNETTLKGSGIGGVVRAEARVVHDPEQFFRLDLRGKILVCRSFVPALSAILPQLAGLVTDYGGMLSHAGFLAREYAVPSIIGTQEATRVFSNGDRLLLDGTRGEVARISEAS